MAGQEGYAQIPPNSTGEKVRILQFQTFVAGVPTTVDVEGVMIVDADGRVVFKPGDNTEMLTLILAELRGLRVQLAGLTGFAGAVIGG